MSATYIVHVHEKEEYHDTTLSANPGTLQPIVHPASKRSSSLAQYHGLFNGPEKAADSKEEEKVRSSSY